MNWRKTVKWVAVGLAAALALLLVAGYLLSFTGAYQSWARALVVRTIQGSLKAEVSVGKVGGNPLYRISVSDLVLTRQGQPLLSADRLSLSYFLPQVIFGTPVVSVALEDFDLSVTRSPEGLNVADLLKPQEPQEAGRRFVVSSLSLEGGKVVYTDATTPEAEPTVIEDLNIEGGLALPASLQEPLVVKLRDASLKMRQPEVVLKSASGTLSHGPKQTSIELEAGAKVAVAELEAKLTASGAGESLKTARGSGRLDVWHYRLKHLEHLEIEGGYGFELAEDTLRISQGELKTTGAVTTFSAQVPSFHEITSGKVSAEAKGKLQVSDLAALSGEPQLTGSADIDYRVRKAWSSKEGLSADVYAKSGRARVADIELDSVSLEASYRPPVLQIAELSAEAKQLGRLRVSGPYEPGKALDLDFSAQSDNIVPLAKRLGATQAAAGSLSATGKLTGAPSNPGVSGTFSGQGLSYAEVKVERASGRFEVQNLLAERQGRLSADLAGVDAGGRKLSQAKVRTTLPQKGALEFSADAQEGPSGASYQAQGTVSGLGEAQTTVSLASLQAQVGRLTVRNTRELPVVLADEVVRLPQVALTSTDNSFSATGSAQAPGPINMDLRFDDANIVDIVRLIRINFPVQGRLTGTAKIGGTTDEPRIDADLTARSGQVSAIVFDTLSANIGYQPEVARIDAKLTVPGGQHLAVRGDVPVKVTLLPPQVVAGSAKGLIQGLGREVVPRLLEDILRGLSKP